MITDHINNFSKYTFGEKFNKAFEFIKNCSLKDLPAGRHEIDGENIFALVNEYNTKPAEAAFLEGHKKYVDLQYMVSGNEYIGYAPFENQEVQTPYDEEKDFHLFYGKCSFIEMHEGIFGIFFPQDLHMPGIMINESKPVKKLIIKISV